MACLSDDQNKQLVELSRRIILLYRDVKAYVVQSEKLSPGARVSIPALNELRNAFDHYMRAETVWRHGVPPGAGTEQDPFKYCLLNLHKALGHVYRAGYDALDILAVNKARQIEKYIDSYRLLTLHTVIKDFTQSVRTPKDEAIKQCDQAKQGKDIEPEQVQEHPRFFGMYKAGLDLFDQVLKVLHSYDKDLLAVEQETKKQDAEDVNRYKKGMKLALWGLAATIVTAIVGVAITFYLARK